MSPQPYCETNFSGLPIGFLLAAPSASRSCSAFACWLRLPAAPAESAAFCSAVAAVWEKLLASWNFLSGATSAGAAAAEAAPGAAGAGGSGGGRVVGPLTDCQHLKKSYHP